MPQFMLCRGRAQASGRLLFCLSTGLLITAVRPAPAEEIEKRPDTPQRTAAVSITEFGAVADGTTDDRPAIQRALDFAAVHGRHVLVPAGSFAYSGTLVSHGVSLSGVGASSRLIALNAKDASLILTGSDICVSSLSFAGLRRSRLAPPSSDLIWARMARNYTIQNVTISGSSNGGIFNEKSSNGLISHNTVENTLADSITAVEGASAIEIRGNRIINSGDDGISVVSYNDAPIVHHITISGNTVLHNKEGRGITVVGGNDVQILGNYVEGGEADTAAVYIAAESQWHTQGVNNVTVAGNTLVDGGGSPAGTGQGAITIYNSQGYRYSLTNIALTDNQIIRPRAAGLQFVGDGPETVLASDNTVYANADSLSSIGNPIARVTLARNVLLPAKTPVAPLVPADGGAAADPQPCQLRQ